MRAQYLSNEIIFGSFTPEPNVSSEQNTHLLFAHLSRSRADVVMVK